MRCFGMVETRCGAAFRTQLDNSERSQLLCWWLCQVFGPPLVAVLAPEIERTNEFRQVGSGQGALVLHPLHDDVTAKAQASLQLGRPSQVDRDHSRFAWRHRQEAVPASM